MEQLARVDGNFTNGGTLSLVTASTKTLGGSLTNSGSGTVVHGDGSLSLDSDIAASVTNDGLWDFTADFDSVTKSGTGADPVFTNNGTVRKSGGTFTSQIGLSVDVVNTGTFEATAGTLDVDDIVSSSGTTFVLGNDAVIQWDGDATEVADISGTFGATGSGTVEWTGEWAAAAPVVFDFAAGVFSLGGDLDATGTTVTNDGAATWTSGRIDGPFTTNDTLTLASVSTKTLGGSLTNSGSGTVVHADGSLSLDSDVATSVTNDGVWDFTADFDSVTKSGTGADPAFTNNGTVRKSGGTFTSQIGLSVDVVNTGTFEATAGTLDVDDIVSAAGGTFVLANDAVIEWDGDFTEIADISGTFTATGVGTVEWTGNYLGTAAVLDFPAGLFEWTSGRWDGTLTNTDTLPLVTASTKTLGGSLTNSGSGTVVHGDGSLSLDASTGAAVVNDGVWDFTADFDSVTKSGTGADPVFTNNGTVRKSGGTFTSQIGISVDVVNTGTFEATAGTLDVDDIVSSSGTTFVLGNDAVIQWDGDATEVADISGTFDSTGAGTVEWTGDWAATVPVTFGFPAGVFTLSGDIDAGGTTITNDGEVTWEFGRIDGGVTNNDTLVLSTVSTKTLGGSLTNAALGTVVHADGWFSLDSDVSTSVTNDGVWDFTADFDNVTKSGTGSDPVFTNNGTVRKSGGTFTSQIGLSVDVVNTGTFEATAGTLDVDDIVSSSGTTFVLGNDAVIQWDGDATEIADISGTFDSTGAGTVEWTGDWAATVPVMFDLPGWGVLARRRYRCGRYHDHQ